MYVGLDAVVEGVSKNVQCDYINMMVRINFDYQLLVKLLITARAGVLINEKFYVSSCFDSVELTLE